MVILVKRAKIFIDNGSGKHRRAAVALRPTGQEVPDWVRDTSGFAVGVQDGSIIDLTPPSLIAAKSQEVAEVEEESESAKNIKALAARHPKGSISSATVKTR